MHIGIVTDSTSDLPQETIARYKVEVVPLHIHMGSETLIDGVDITKDEFYTRLPEYDPSPTTAAPGPDVFKKAYARLADAGAKQILSLHISERLSATIASARTAAREFTRIPVKVLDSGQLSMGLGFLVEKAGQLAENLDDVEQILARLKEQMERSYVFAALKTLEYLRRSGRMHIAVARLGELLRIKPLLHMHLGKANAHRVRTYNKGIQRLLSWLEAYAPYENLAILHAGVQADAENLRRQVLAYLPGKEIPIIQITPVLGTHLGIGALGFACVSERSWKR